MVQNNIERNFHIEPTYITENSIRDEEHDIFLHLKNKTTKILKIDYFTYRLSLEELSKTLDRIIQIYKDKNCVHDLTDPELMQFYLFHDLIEVKQEKGRLSLKVVRHDKIHDINLFSKDFREYLSFTFFPIEITNAVGSIWYAGERTFPYIGYYPSEKAFLLSEFSQYRQSQPDLWLNEFVSVDDFISAFRQFIPEELVKQDDLYTNIFKKMENISGFT